jgi:hypothetical protein
MPAARSSSRSQSNYFEYRHQLPTSRPPLTFRTRSHTLDLALPSLAREGCRKLIVFALRMRYRRGKTISQGRHLTRLPGHEEKIDHPFIRHYRGSLGDFGCSAQLAKLLNRQTGLIDHLHP